YYKIDFFKRSALPFLYRVDQGIGNIGHAAGVNLDTVNLFYLFLYVSSAHAPGIKSYDYLGDLIRQPAFMLGNNLWIKLTITIPGNIYRYFSQICFKRFRIITVAGVTAVITFF